MVIKLYKKEYYKKKLSLCNYSKKSLEKKVFQSIFATEIFDYFYVVTFVSNNTPQRKVFFLDSKTSLHIIRNPKGWKSSIITPLIKKGKDPKDVRSYKEVALTNTLCKIFERLTNKGLIWYLKKEKKKGW